jgi:hypothetical protein
VSARQPGFGTASLGTDGARFSTTRGPVNGSAGTSGLNAGLEHCAELYPFPTQAGRLGGRVCAQVSPNGVTGTVTPGLQLPTGTQVGPYYRFTYNPLADDPSEAPVQLPPQSTASSTDGQLLELLRQRTAERLYQQQMDDQLAAEIAANAYNPPAEFRGQAPPQASAPQEAPAPAGQPTTGMTEAEFRAELARIHEEFQRAEEFHRQNPLNIPVPQEHQTPPIGDVPPAGVRPRIEYDEYAPRNGYDAQGNRSDSPRRRYDEHGNYAAPAPAPYSTAIDSSTAADFWQSQQPRVQPAPQRQNRVYNAYDGTSRPIGSGRSSAAQQYAAMQQWSNNQIAAMNAQRSAPAASGGYSAPPAGEASPQTTRFGYDESARRGSQIVYDDNAPRQSTRLINDESSTNRASTGGSSVLDEAPQRPISSPVYDHRPGQSGIVDPGTSSPPDIAPRQSGQSAPTAALRW